MAELDPEHVSDDDIEDGVNAPDSNGPFHYQGKKIADDQVELAQWMKDGSYYPSVYVVSDHGNVRELSFDYKAILKAHKSEKDVELEDKFSGKSDRQLEIMIEKLDAKMDQVADGTEYDIQRERIFEELERRNKARNKGRRKDLPKRKPHKKAKSAKDGAPKAKKPSTGKSKTSGWAKLKETMPSSGMARARLAQGGHTPFYSKVLENLARYWEKRGK